MNEELVLNLQSLGFSKLEAEVYVSLVQGKSMSGYAIAKVLNKTRPAVYNALDNLLEKGFVNFVRRKNGTEYVAVEPELLLSDISRKVTGAAGNARKIFKELESKKIAPRFENIEGKSNLLATANRIIMSARKEILMNSSMPLEPLYASLKEAARQKVRIILFSWQKIDTLDLPIEFYSNFDGTNYCSEERLFLVADLKRCVIGSNDTSAFIPHKKTSKKLPAGEKDFLGMTSTNRLLVNMVTEHIHFDIYLHKLKRKRRLVFTDDIQLHSLMERGI